MTNNNATGLNFFILPPENARRAANKLISFTLRLRFSALFDGAESQMPAIAGPEPIQKTLRDFFDHNLTHGFVLAQFLNRLDRSVRAFVHHFIARRVAIGRPSVTELLWRKRRRGRKADFAPAL
jgi:hypothetical protein